MLQPSSIHAGAPTSGKDNEVADQPVQVVATPIKPLASCLLPASDMDKLFVGKAEMSHGDLGRVVSIFDATSAHALGVLLLTKAASLSSVSRIILIACWCDLEDVTQALLSCKEYGHNPSVYVDHRTTLANTARDQLVRLLELRANGISVKVVRATS